MYVLGLSGFAHESAAALVRDGEILSLVEEERLNRIKQTTDFPRLAIRECLRMAGIRAGDINEFAFYFRPGLELASGVLHGIRYLPGSLNLFKGTHGGDEGSGLPFPKRIRTFLGVGRLLQEELKLERKPKLRYVEHHVAHAASAFYPSPFGDAAILTWDGRGEFACTAGFVGGPTGIRKVLQVNIPHSMGHFYSAITDYLGFKAFSDEWKVMGMSAYGGDALVESFRDLFVLKPRGRYLLNLDYFAFQHYGRRRFLSDRFLATFGPPRNPADPVTQRHRDVAFAAQRAIEEIGIHVARYLRETSGLTRLCMAGGVAQNILLNSRVAERSGFEEVFVQPVSTDAGAALGAALHVAFGRCGLPRVCAMQDAYLGPEFSERDIESALTSAGLAFERPSDLCVSVAQALAAGKIGGWFQGRMEAGPRALGNRSLIASPCRLEHKDRLNARIKRRESFRPFAPAVVAERAGEFFSEILPSPARFMAASALVRPEVRERIPAVVHADGSARPQIVDEASNPMFWRLLNEFDRAAGVPVLLNTSFNEQEPIVCTPADAIRTFQRTEIDFLAIGPFLVERLGGATSKRASVHEFPNL